MFLLKLIPRSNRGNPSKSYPGHFSELLCTYLLSWNYEHSKFCLCSLLSILVKIVLLDVSVNFLSTLSYLDRPL